MKKLLPYIIILTSFVLSLFSLSNYPYKYAVHWGITGEADGFATNRFGLFFIPIMLLVLQVFLVLVPKIDPKKKNIEKFSGAYERFILSFHLLFLYLQIIMFVWNVISEFNFTQVTGLGMGLFFISISDLIKHAKSNYTIGIRTPWTLVNEQIWDKTHQLGAKLIKYISIIAIITLPFAKYSFFILIGGVLLSFLFLTFYSFYLFKKDVKK